MPSTHLSLHYHIIFATKERRPFIAPELRERLHAYLGGVLREMDAIPQCVGGVADHIHILAGLKATHCLADVMRDLKRASSEWVHETIGDRAFAWQEGYGASRSVLPCARMCGITSNGRRSTTARAPSGRNTSSSSARAVWSSMNGIWIESRVPAPHPGRIRFFPSRSGGVASLRHRLNFHAARRAALCF